MLSYQFKQVITCTQGKWGRGKYPGWQKNQEFDILGFELFRKKLVLWMVCKRGSLSYQMRKFELKRKVGYRAILRETQTECHCQRYLDGSPEQQNKAKISSPLLAPDWQVPLDWKINVKGEIQVAESHYLAWSILGRAGDRFQSGLTLNSFCSNCQARFSFSNLNLDGVSFYL